MWSLICPVDSWSYLGSVHHGSPRTIQNPQEPWLPGRARPTPSYHYIRNQAFYRSIYIYIYGFSLWSHWLPANYVVVTGCPGIPIWATVTQWNALVSHSAPKASEAISSEDLRGRSSGVTWFFEVCGWSGDPVYFHRETCWPNRS